MQTFRIMSVCTRTSRTHTLGSDVTLEDAEIRVTRHYLVSVEGSTVSKITEVFIEDAATVESLDTALAGIERIPQPFLYAVLSRGTGRRIVAEVPKQVADCVVRVLGGQDFQVVPVRDLARRRAGATMCQCELQTLLHCYTCERDAQAKELSKGDGCIPVAAEGR